MSNNSKHSVSVAGVIINNDNNEAIIIQRDDNSEWQLPGGVLELDETIQQGLKREILEETGLIVEIEALTGIYKNLKVGVVALVFKCKYLTGIPRTCEETKQVCWVDFAEAAEMLNSTFKTRFSDAIAFDKSPAIRNHNGINFIPDE